MNQGPVIMDPSLVDSFAHGSSIMPGISRRAGKDRYPAAAFKPDAVFADGPNEIQPGLEQLRRAALYSQADDGAVNFRITRHYSIDSGYA